MQFLICMFAMHTRLGCYHICWRIHVLLCAIIFMMVFHFRLRARQKKSTDKHYYYIWKKDSRCKMQRNEDKKRKE